MGKIGTDKKYDPSTGQIFVFGSNRAGIHGAGAARVAWQQYGAIWEQGEGLMGQSYALPTKDEQIQKMSLEQIKEHVDKFIMFAWERTDLKFFVTRIGCGLAGWSDHEIGPLFADAPPNCELPYGWGSRED